MTSFNKLFTIRCPRGRMPQISGAVLGACASFFPVVHSAQFEIRDAELNRNVKRRLRQRRQPVGDVAFTPRCVTCAQNRHQLVLKLKENVAHSMAKWGRLTCTRTGPSRSRNGEAQPASSARSGSAQISILQTPFVAGIG